MNICDNNLNIGEIWIPNINPPTPVNWNISTDDILDLGEIWIPNITPPILSHLDIANNLDNINISTLTTTPILNNIINNVSSNDLNNIDISTPTTTTPILNNIIYNVSSNDQNNIDILTSTTSSKNNNIILSTIDDNIILNEIEFNYNDEKEYKYIDLLLLLFVLMCYYF